MNGLRKSLTASPINQAADELLARLAELTDNNGDKLFESVDSGIWVPAQNANGDNTPAARVWYQHPQYLVDSPQFFTGVRKVLYTIAVYLWLPTKDASGVVTDPQRVLADYADAVLQSLQLLDVNGVGWEWSASFWGPSPEQKIQLDWHDRMAKFNNNVPLQPPWYVVQIPFMADVYNKK